MTIDYVVTAPAGELINDAFLSANAGNFGGTGVWSISETLVNAVTSAPIAAFEANALNPSVLVTFPGVNSIVATKDIFLYGGTLGETLSVISQGYSSTTSIPEPSSIALLGIGMTGFLAFRRLFKRASAA